MDKNELEKGLKQFIIAAETKQTTQRREVTLTDYQVELIEGFAEELEIDFEDSVMLIIQLQILEGEAALKNLTVNQHSTRN